MPHHWATQATPFSLLKIISWSEIHRSECLGSLTKCTHSSPLLQSGHRPFRAPERPPHPFPTDSPLPWESHPCSDSCSYGFVFTCFQAPCTCIQVSSALSSCLNFQMPRAIEVHVRKGCGQGLSLREQLLPSTSLEPGSHRQGVHVPESPLPPPACSLPASVQHTDPFSLWKPSLTGLLLEATLTQHFLHSPGTIMMKSLSCYLSSTPVSPTQATPPPGARPGVLWVAT